MSRKKSKDPLKKWLDLTWERPERSYNPDLRDFLADLLNYPKRHVITEDIGPTGYPDFKLLTLEKVPWVVGDLRKNDDSLATEEGRLRLWREKSKYVEGLTRYVMFLTPHYLWVVKPDGATVEGPIDLRKITIDDLRTRLNFLSYEKAKHDLLWQEFVAGKFPYSYLKFEEEGVADRFRQDLQAAFEELTQAAEQVLEDLQSRYEEYIRKRQEIERNLGGQEETRGRALMRLELEYSFARRLFEETFPQFEEQYGREIEVKGSDKERKIKERILEAFTADSVAALIARILFLRLVEDLGLTEKRRLTNGGPSRWAEFVEFLTGSATALVQVASKDVYQLYREPFAESVFEWLQHTDGMVNEVLQRLILRLNAYDFSGLSEEILGDIYQQFLPPQKRKRLGEYYTPSSIVNWIIEQTVLTQGEGSVLDPACGSGSFLVHYLHRRLDDARRRGLPPREVRQEVQDQIWGFDLNPFAAFISHFQLMWGLLRFHPEGSPPKIHIYNLNSLLKDQDIASHLGEEHLPPGSLARDGGRWRYVVGNPPYIRAERVKYGEEMKRLWEHVWGQNADTGLLFLYRSLSEWLEEGGHLGMVVSGGYANSEAATPVWRLLHPRGRATLRKLVWLEFTEQNGKQKLVWEMARVPLILIIERTTPKEEEDEIEIYVPPKWPCEQGNLIPVKVHYKDFFDRAVSPQVTQSSTQWGEYLLPLLHPEDVPILKKLYPNGKQFVSLKEAVKERRNRRGRKSWWTYGIQRGGVAVTEKPEGKRPVQVIPGRTLAVAWPGEPMGYVDLEAVKDRPYGKLSLWGDDTIIEKFLAIPEIGLAPTAALVEGIDLAALNTLVVAVPRENGPAPEAIAAYINSKLARFYWAVRLRSGVIQGYYAHIYPRTLEALPWPANLPEELEESLVEGYNQLAKLAEQAKNNPNDWLLKETDARIKKARLKLGDPDLDISFEGWPEDEDEAPKPSELELYGSTLRAGLFATIDLVDPELAELVYKLLILTSDDDEEAPVTRGILYKLVVPKTYKGLVQEYRKRLKEFREVETKFMEVFERIDQVIYQAFGLSEEEVAHIEERLTSFPLDRLHPRYPWEVVKPRPIRAYLEDRFA